MIKGYQEKLMNIYEKIREDENLNLKNIKNEILQKATEIIEKLPEKYFKLKK